MKRRELEKLLRRMGWTLLREGRRHRIFGDGERTMAVPRHREINEYTAQRIVEIAKGDT